MSFDDEERWFDTRLQLHWAAQAAAGVGRTLIPSRPDDSHTNFRWNERLGALQQGEVPGSGMSAAIRLRDCALLLVDQNDIVLDALPLTGKTLADAFLFYESRFSEWSGVATTLQRPPEGMPDHAVARGAGFLPHPDALADLAQLYSDAAQHLERIRSSERGASEVRCWPHHFDIATLIEVAPASNGHDARTIGVGMVPGDGSYREPYWYVTPWPYPADREKVEPLERGFWNREGWFGAAMLRSKLGEGQDEIASFLREAIERSRQLIS